MKKLFKVNGHFDIGALIISLIATGGTLYLSTAYSMPSPSYYNELVKPAFAPSLLIFLAVFILLYMLLSLAAYRVWMNKNSKKGVFKALFTYFLQLILSFIWCLIFFKYKLIAIAFFEIIIFLFFIVLTTFRFFKIDKISGVMLLPYFLSIGFISVLNYLMWILNS